VSGISTLSNSIFHTLLAMVLLPGSLLATETFPRRINHIPLVETKKIDAPAPIAELSLKILSVSAGQSRLWAEKGQAISGGWKFIPNPETIKTRLIASRKIWINSGAGIKVEAGNIRPIRHNIRNWLKQHGVPDTPDLMLHPIDIGFTIQGKWIKRNMFRLTLSPWLRLTHPAGITAPAQIEVLPELGTTSSPKQPPSTAAPLRLNIQPLARSGFQHYIGIAGAHTEIDISAGQPVMLFASRDEARALGKALLSKAINGQGKFIVIRLLLKN